MIKYWIAEGGKSYWEGPAEQMSQCIDPVEVPRQPSPDFRWKDAWVFDPKLAEENRQAFAYSEMQRLKPRETFGDDATIEDYKNYMAALRTWCLNPQASDRKPECPASLK